MRDHEAYTIYPEDTWGGFIRGFTRYWVAHLVQHTELPEGAARAIIEQDGIGALHTHLEGYAQYHHKDVARFTETI